MKLKQMLKRGACLVASLILVCCDFTSYAADEKVKISDKEYILAINNRINLFIGNNTPVSGEVGSKVFLTYTVAEVKENTAAQHGVIASKDKSLVYPYTQGGAMAYSGGNLLDVGYTYVFRLERTKDGFEYQGIKLKDKEEHKIKFRKYTGEKDGTFTHFGLWFGGAVDTRVNALLTHVRCYDEKGNDLGIYPSHVVDEARMHQELLDTHMTINHSYDFSFKNNWNLVISNEKPVTDPNAIVYMEYEVGEVAKDEATQVGLIMTGAPEENYPFQYNRGRLKYSARAATSEYNSLMRPGGKYLICFKKEKDDFVGLVQRTVNGQTDTFYFTGLAGSYDPAYGYCSIWIGDSTQVSCEFKNFKCYDSKGNSLGVQFNKKNIAVTHKGEIEDYSTCLAAYYCKENDSFVVLQDEKKAYKESAGVRETASYHIENNILTMSYKSGKEGYQYLDVVLKDEEANKYVRLKPQKVQFVYDGEKEILEATAENGYRVEALELKDKKDNKFLGWTLSNGKKFDFDTIITETITLYAEWENGEEVIYTDNVLQNKTIRNLLIGVGSSVLIISACIVVCIQMTKRRKQ